MDGWFGIRTFHGTDLHTDTETGAACSALAGTGSGRFRRLLGWQPPGRRDLVFLTPEAPRPSPLHVPPEPFANTILPFRAVPTATEGGIALFDHGARRYLCAAPPGPGEPVAAVTVDRSRVSDWETFHLLPISPAELPSEVIARMSALGRLLGMSSGAGLTAEGVLAFLHGEALDHADAALNATLPLMSLAELQRAAEFIRDVPALSARLAQAMPADVFAAAALPELSRWLARREEAASSRRRLRIGANLDFLADAGYGGVPVSIAHACNALARASVQPRREICLVATARNEGVYLLEWIAYHRAIGVEAFFLYSNDNDDGSDALLGALADAGVITWIDSEVGLGKSAQNKAFGHSLGVLPDTLDYCWALLIDLDEFFVFDPDMFGSIRDFLRYHELRQTDAIAANWVFIGSSGQNVWRDEPVTARFTRQLHGGVYPAVKTVCRPSQFIHSTAHFPRTHNRRSFVFRNAAGDLHSYTKAPLGPELAPASSDHPDPRFACIYHYFFKSAEELLWKFSRNRGDHPKTAGIANTALEPYMVNEFVAQHHATDLPEDDRIRRCAPNLEVEIAALRALPGVSAAVDSVQRIYRERIGVIKEAYRDAPVIRQAGGTGRHFLQLAGLADVSTSALDRMTPAELVAHFQSLGDNCEFGIVQRRCGAEPLGLLRFSFVDRGKLLEGLGNGFAGLGEPEDIEFQMFGPDGSPKEYMVYAKRYTLVYHTWVYDNLVTADEMRAQEQMKLQFLKQKFFEDLEDGEKLWVYKTNDPVPVGAVQQLVAALRGFGDNTLLWVVPHDAQHPPGTVIRLGDGLLRGHIDRFASYADATNVSVEGWLAVCRSAYALWRPEPGGT